MATIDQLNQWGVRLVLAMMRSASAKKIKPIDRWTRGRSALETAAQSSDHFSAMVSIMGRKLQLETLYRETVEEVAALTAEIDDFGEFARHCSDEGLYVTAMAQAQRRDERTEEEEQAVEAKKRMRKVDAKLASVVDEILAEANNTDGEAQ